MGSEFCQMVKGNKNQTIDGGNHVFNETMGDDFDPANQSCELRKGSDNDNILSQFGEMDNTDIIGRNKQKVMEDSVDFEDNFD